MALIVEDGSIVAGANSYVDDTEALAIADAIGVTLSTDSAEREKHLKQGANYIAVKCLKGTVVEQFQDMAFPRNDLNYKGFLVPNDVILKEVKYAQVAAAGGYFEGANTTPVDDGKNIKKEQIDVLVVEYFDNGKTTSGVKLVGADQWLKGLTCSVRSLRITRC